MALAIPVTANVAQQRQQHNTNNRGYNNNKKQYNNNYGNSSSSHPQSQQRSPRPYLGKCQICNTQGHSARRCPQFQPQMPMSTPQYSPFRPWQPRANLAVGGSYYDPNPWLLDSGATHHMTSDLHNLSLHEPYNGGDDVIVANGSPLPITHTGSKLLPSQTRALNLNRVLCVPDIHR